jgi:hypothetical protein
MECYGPEDLRDEWNHACIHPDTVAYSCGRLFRSGRPNEHDHDPDEITRCGALASQAAELIEGVSINLSESESIPVAFFITANRNDPVRERLTPDVIRDFFNGTIYPEARVVVDALGEGGVGWEAFAVSDEPEEDLPAHIREELAPLMEMDRRNREERARRWRALMSWFEAQEEITAGAFVLVGHGMLGESNFGCVFPRLVVGLTRAGSLVGVCGHAVQT